jgi:hypothetical protein
MVRREALCSNPGAKADLRWRKTWSTGLGFKTYRLQEYLSRIYTYAARVRCAHGEFAADADVASSSRHERIPDGGGWIPPANVR